MKLSRLALSFFSCVLACLSLRAAEPAKPAEVEIVIEGDSIEMEFATGVAKATNGVTARYRDAVLTANRAELDQRTGEVVAEGAVSLQRDNLLWRGERLRYNFFTRQIQADEFRTGREPFYAWGLGLTANLTNQTYTASTSYLTSDDAPDPGYRVRAKSLTIVPGKSFEARQATLYLGSVPIMYFPYYRRPLDRHPNQLTVTPGYRSRYGPYLLGTYDWPWRTNVAGTVHLDYRLFRGFGLGPGVQYDLGRLGEGTANYYWTRDENPGKDPSGFPIRTYRHRVSFSHQAVLRTNLTAKVAVREQSDAFFTRDFFEGEYRRDTQPRSFLELNQAWSNWTLDLLAQPQINDFFETVERLPDVKLTGLRQQLGISPLYYDSESSVGYFRHKFAELSHYATNREPDPFAAFRADTYHQLLWPQQYFGWLNVTPRAGGRFTHYGEVDGDGTVAREQDRWVFNTGVEASFKASRIFRGAQSKLLEVDQLRHIVQPSINYVCVPTPNARPPELPQFDAELPSLRLLPIDFPDYNNIDSIDAQNAIRFGLLNKLQTKRAGSIDNLLEWQLYADWRLSPRHNRSMPDIYGHPQNLRGDQTFSDLYSDFEFKPRSWMTLHSQIRYGINDTVWRQLYHTLTLQPTDVWSYTIGHRYLRDEPTLYGLGNNLIVSSLYYRLNENWAVRLLHEFEARDGRLERQNYTLYRDFRSWTGALSFRVREHSDGLTEVGVAVSFSIKAFPRFGLGQDRDHPELLFGG
jgi:lipopolysaccharide assembly outer membrane protein LptD (OstA)